MLAYVFWHWPATVPAAVYSHHLRAFHDALRLHPPQGFHHSHTYRFAHLPWGPPPTAEPTPTYEDWYLVDDFQSLGNLNDAAVSGARQASHDAVAPLALNGTAGLYRLRPSSTAPASPTPTVQHANWFSKPPGMTYAALFALLDKFTADHSCRLWQRQMTFGPATEFCIHATDDIQLPDAIPLRQHFEGTLI